MLVRKSILVLILFVACKIAFCISVTGIFEARMFVNKKNEFLPYRFLQPREIIPGRRYPLVLFFHGAGERGNDDSIQLCNGVQLFCKPENLAKYPCFMIVPQCPVGLKWVDTDWHLDSHHMPDTPSAPLRLSLELLQQIISSYPVDTMRIYVTGVSMGGFATWDIIQRYPAKFAAAAPVCGGADEEMANRIKDVPVWAFHGGKDRVVKPIRSEHIIASIQQAGGHPIFNEYPALGHNAWDSAYKDDKILVWMFNQNLHLRHQ